MFDDQYLTFTEYGNLGGTLAVDAFNLLEYKSRKKVDKETQQRLVDLTEQKDEVKLCIFDLINVIDENNTTILSESADGYGITLMDKKELRKAEFNIIKDYLSGCKIEDGTPYLYRGGVKTALDVVVVDEC